MTARRGFRHEALIYSDADAFLAATAPFLRAALEAGEPALVAVRRENTVLLEGELGKDAGAVRFADIEAFGRNPARIIPFWHEFVAGHGGKAVRGIGEPVWPGRAMAEVDECQRHESLLNVAFSRPPEWSLLCPYDAGGLDDAVLEKVACSHPVVEQVGVRGESGDYVAAVDCFAGELAERPDGGDTSEFDRTGLFDVRQRVEWAAKSARLPAQRTADLVLAASELAANSIVHGGGGGRLYVWRQGGSLLVEVEDRGSIAQPLVGRERPTPTQVGGRGLWIANQVCDLVQIRSGAAGTVVRLHMNID